MAQYHYFKINSESLPSTSASASSSSASPSSAFSFDMPSNSNTSPFIMSVGVSDQEKRLKLHKYHHEKDLNPVYSNNGPSPISLDGLSFINASPINKIKLPSIKELDNMIINPISTNQPIETKSTTVPQLPPIMSTTTTTTTTATKRPFSIIVEHKYRATTAQNNRPLKHQNNENKKKLKPSHSKQQCHSCNSTETPEWRKGPLGPRTLCNACGLIWTKLCKQNEEDNQSKKSSTDITPLSSPTSSQASSSTSSSSSKSSNKNNINCQKYTLSFLLT